jgi:DNA-directed RNA polymerase subunit RPC12/RpoP
VQTLTYNCPVCKAGKLEFTAIHDVSFEPNEEHISPVIVNITGEIRCNNCGAKYFIKAKDVKAI